MTKRRPGNPKWGQAHIITTPIMWAPAQWEILLKSMHIKDDSHALEVMSGKTEKSKQLRTWIGLYAGSRFVPTQVLEMAQLKTAIDLKFLSGWGAE